MIDTIRSQPVRTLCTLAQADESTLSFPLPDHIFGFHAQQACEKLMKALIASLGKPYPFTHDLGELEDILTGLNEQMPDTPTPIPALTRFAVTLRYDIWPELPAVDRPAVCDSLAMLREHILTRILAIEAATQTRSSL